MFFLALTDTLVVQISTSKKQQQTYVEETGLVFSLLFLNEVSLMEGGGWHADDSTYLIYVLRVNKWSSQSINQLIIIISEVRWGEVRWPSGVEICGTTWSTNDDLE